MADQRPANANPNRPETDMPRQGSPDKPVSDKRMDRPQETRTEPGKRPEMMMRERAEPTRHGGAMWPEMDQYRHRFAELQAEFIEEPRDAVTKAEQLVEEAVDRMTGVFHERLQRIHGDIDGEPDTEKLRLAMRSFREFIDSLGGHHQAA
jgi:hypothetical protein